MAIDIGHSRTDPGTTSARGIDEYHFNRRLAYELLAALVEAGYSRSFLVDAHGIRTGSAGLRERTRRLRGSGARILVSIHHDSVQERYLKPWTFRNKQRRYSDRYRGYSIIYSSRSAHAASSLELAVALGDEFLAKGLRPTQHHAEDIDGERRTLVDPRRGIYDIDFWIVRSAPVPAVLLEAGVITDPEEEKLLSQSTFRKRIIEAILASVTRIWRSGNPPP